MIDYRGFIQENFLIRNKDGEIVPFIFNETQNYYYDLLLKECPQPSGMVYMSGIRENILKFRQPGFSSLIDGIFTVDFIFSEMAKIPLTDGDIVSHKASETEVLFKRVDQFLNSYLEKEHIPRDKFLDIDTTSHLKGMRGAELHVQTASAKVSGRGGTKQNIHWSEVAFYPNTEILNAETLVTGAEQQVPEGKGKIFRETTGNMAGDFFASEYEAGKDPEAVFKSRFLAWWIHRSYTLRAPEDWQIPEYYHRLTKEHLVSKDQCYWHWRKTHKKVNGVWVLDPLKLREYPTYEIEAFILGGEKFFDKEALTFYQNSFKSPIYESVIYV